MSAYPHIDGAKVERAFMRATCLQLHEEAQAAARAGVGLFFTTTLLLQYN